MNKRLAIMLMTLLLWTSQQNANAQVITATATLEKMHFPATLIGIPLAVPVMSPNYLVVSGHHFLRDDQKPDHIEVEVGTLINAKFTPLKPPIKHTSIFYLTANGEYKSKAFSLRPGVYYTQSTLFYKDVNGQRQQASVAHSQIVILP